jgi:IPT/TIG domain
MIFRTHGSRGATLMRAPRWMRGMRPATGRLIALCGLGAVLLGGFVTWLALGPAAGATPLASSLLVARAVGAASTSASAFEVPATATLNAGGYSHVDSLSCASSGNCAAGGYYTDGSGHQQAFIVDRVNGTWGRAAEVPGTATLNAGGHAAIGPLSCASAGNCAAGGSYTDHSGHVLPFVAGEVNGTWGRAADVPGMATLDGGRGAGLASLSCAAEGNCAAGGDYVDGSGHEQAFVVSEIKGTWSRAAEVPGTAKLNAGGAAEVDSLFCVSAGNCVAGGFYVDGSRHLQAFVVAEVKGTWGRAKEVTGTATLNAGGLATINSLSCASAGNCAAGGHYLDGSRHQQAFAVAEVNGSWGTATEVPGTATLNAGGLADIDSLSCAPEGDCAAGGHYRDRSGHTQVFVVKRVNGTWGNAAEVPGTAALNADGDDQIEALSCASAGNCAAGGYYTDRSGHQQAFVVEEVNGTWGSAAEVPGTATLDAGGGAQVDALSCASTAICAAGGYCTDGSAHQQAFVVEYAPPAPAITRLSPSKGPRSGGTMVTISGTSLLAPTAVHFGAKTARILKVLSATKLEVISPKGTGTVAVSVTTAGGTSAKTAADRFRYLKA